MAKFKKGSNVYVKYPNGLERAGVVVALVKKRSLPNHKKYPFSKAPAGMGRGHISYVVESGGEHFWPLVKYIQAA